MRSLALKHANMDRHRAMAEVLIYRPQKDAGSICIGKLVAKIDV